MCAMPPNRLRTHPPRVARTAAITIGLLIAARPAAAGVFRLGPLSAFLELRHETSDDRSGTRHHVSEDQRSEELAARLTLRASAIVFDPRILTLDLGIGASSRRGTLEREGDSDSLAEGVDGYDFTLALLPQNRFSLSASSSRSSGTSDLPYSFATRSEARTSRIELGMARVAMPGTLSWSRAAVREAADNPLARGRHDVQESLAYRGLRVAGQSRLDANLRLLDFEDRMSRQLGNRYASADFRYELREINPTLASLSSSLSYFGRSGALRQTGWLVAGSAGLRHTASLTSNHSLSARQDEAADGGQTSLNWSSGLRHQLYRSLATSVRASANDVRRHDGSRLRRVADGELAYRKSLPAHGALQVHLRGAYERLDTDLPGGQLFVAGEVHVARHATPFLLDQSNVVPGSITVTSEGGSVIYEEGLDWAVSTAGTASEIRVFATGSIADEQPLRVSYRIFLPAKVNAKLRRFGYSVDLDWRFVGLFVRRSESNESTSALVPERFANDQSDGSYGLRLRWQHGRWSANASAARLRQRAPLAIYTQTDTWAVVNGEILRGLDFRIGAQKTTLDFDLPERERRIRTAELGLIWRPGSRLSIELRGEYRQFTDSIDQNESLLLSTVRGQWTYGKLAVTVIAGRWSLDRELETKQAFRSFISVSRRL